MKNEQLVSINMLGIYPSDIKMLEIGIYGNFELVVYLRSGETVLVHSPNEALEVVGLLHERGVVSDDLMHRYEETIDGYLNGAYDFGGELGA